MSRVFRWATVFGFIIVYVACAPVKFSSESNPGQAIQQSCVSTREGCQFDYTKTIEGAKVDILFVVDNSASMSFEQKALAQRFNGFIQLLDSKRTDYRIAITTTDIHETGDNNEPRAINGNGALQNGNLISFGSGINYLTPSVPDRVGRFNSTIVRGETAQCEQFIANWISQNGTGTVNTSAYQTQYKTNCPSGDERGTYSANLTVSNNPQEFIRSDAYLAIIFVADEDVRSGLYCNGPNNPTCMGHNFELTDKDQPLQLFNAFKARGKDKITEIHSIVVKDSTCLAEQNSQTLGLPGVAATKGFVNGSMGSVYLTFAQGGWGESISICMNSYSSSLESIADKIATKGEILACDNPRDLEVIPIPAVVGFSYQRDGKNITFSTQPPQGTQIRYVYSCSEVN